MKIEYCGKKGKQQGSAQIYYHSSKLQKEMNYKNNDITTPAQVSSLFCESDGEGGGPHG